jgi:hypothetical protein
LNLVMVRLIHRALLFNLPIQWKSEIERATILELSYDKTHSSTVYFSIF